MSCKTCNRHIRTKAGEKPPEYCKKCLRKSEERSVLLERLAVEVDPRETDSFLKEMLEKDRDIFVVFEKNMVKLFKVSETAKKDHIEFSYTCRNFLNDHYNKKVTVYLAPK